ncbi:MAG: hypothetical protein ABW141_18255 [Candidatus Thiodiazotropha endolucinida]
MFFLFDEDLFLDILRRSAWPVGADGDGANIQIGIICTGIFKAATIPSTITMSVPTAIRIPCLTMASNMTLSSGLLT